MVHMMVMRMVRFLPNRVDIFVESCIEYVGRELADRGQQQTPLSSGASVGDGLLFLHPKCKPSRIDFGFPDPFAQLISEPIDRVSIVQFLICYCLFVRW